MYPANYSLNRLVRQTIYALKRQFGGTIDLYRLLSTDTDPRTGAATISKDVTRIDRAVVLPLKVARDVSQSISLISSNKQMVMGGTYDEGTRLFIVDCHDAPDLTLTKDCWLVYKGKKFAIDHFQVSEFDSSWVITGKQLLGEEPEQIFLLAADNLLALCSETRAG